MDVFMNNTSKIKIKFICKNFKLNTRGMMIYYIAISIDVTLRSTKVTYSKKRSVSKRLQEDRLHQMVPTIS